MSQALYRKWRPQTWDSVVGQDHVVDTLRNALAAEKQAHAYLFAGPRGTGKTTTARLLAKAVNCLQEDPASRPCEECQHCQAIAQGRFLDLIEIDAASNTSVDDVRDLRDKINFAPNQARYKVYIVDEVHMLSTAAFNALLKTLEEPPPHAIFVLATTEVHKIPPTVLSRCQRHEFRRIPVVDIVAQLETIAEGEGIQADPEALTLIARQSTGALRDAISLLDQLASTGRKIELEMTHDVLGTSASQSVLDVVGALIEGQADAGLDHIHAALDGGGDPRQFARQVVDYLRDLLLIRLGNADQVDVTAEARAQMASQAQVFDNLELLRLIRIFNHAANEARSAWQPSLPLEMAFVESLVPSLAPEGGTQAVRAPAPVPVSAPAPRRADAPPPSPEGEGAPQESEELSPQDQQATQTLAEAWRKILNLVRQENPRAYGLMNSCKSYFMRGDRLILNFASDLLKKQMEKPENAEIAGKALGQIFGYEVLIECKVDTARRDAVPPGVDNDGMVAAALRDLGGELVDTQ
jgi:DNA polymerase-3 subunit gamma/tau